MLLSIHVQCIKCQIKKFIFMVIVFIIYVRDKFLQETFTCYETIKKKSKLWFTKLFALLPLIILKLHFWVSKGYKEKSIEQYILA